MPVLESPEQPFVAVEKQKKTGLHNLENLLAKYLDAQNGLAESRNAPEPPKVIASADDLVKYESFLESVNKRAEKATSAKENLATARQDLLSALPYSDVPFKLKVNGKEYFVLKESKSPPDLRFAVWDDSLLGGQ